MGFQLSPGVNVSEIDLTGFIPAVATTGAGFVGQFEWGPVLDYTTLENKKLLEKWFGKPNDVNYRDWFTCSNFLDYSNNLNIIRVVDEAVALNSDVTGTGILIKNDVHYNLIYGTPTGDASYLSAKYPGDKGDSIRIIIIDSNTYGDIADEYKDILPNPPSTSDYVKSIGGENDELHIIVLDALGLFTGVPNAVLEVYTYVSKAKDAIDLDGKPIFYGSVLNKESEYIWFLEVPDSADYAIAGSVSSITVTDGGTGYTTAPVVTITDSGSGLGATATAVLATTGMVWNNVTVDTGGLYTAIPTVTVSGVTSGTGATAVAVLDSAGTITDVTITNGGSGFVVGESISITGDGTGANIEVATINAGEVLTVTINNGGTGYTTATVDTAGSSAGIGLIATTTLSFAVTAVTVTAGGIGYDDATMTFDETFGTGATVTPEIQYAIASVTVTAGGADYVESTTTIDIAIENGTQATAEDVVLVGAGYDGVWNTKALNTQYKSLESKWDKTFSGGVDSASVDENELIAGWDMFQNSEIVDVSLLILGDAGQDLGAYSHTTVVKHVVENIAERRKDCVAFFSPRYEDVVNQPETLGTENCISRRNSINLSSSYAFMDSGWKYQYDVYNDTYRWVPLNADTAGVCAQSDKSRDPWWSPAGFNRGQIKNVIKLALNPNSGNRDELYQNNINPVVSFVGEGVLLYGDRTQLTRPSLFQKLNVRRLFIVVEKAIARSAKYQLFEFNDAFTRASFVSRVEPYLREVQGRRGINDFHIVCDETNNTGEVIDRSEFVGDIYIKPNNSINFIQLNFVAVRNGVEFNEVIGKF